MQSASRARPSADDRAEDRLIVGVVGGQHLMDEELVVSSRRRKRVGVIYLTTPVGPPRAPRVGTPPDDDSLNHDHGAYSAGRLAVCVPVKRGRSGRPDQSPRFAVAKPTEPVNGAAADCLTDPKVPGSCSAIRWQYAPDAWARVSYAGSAGATPAQAAAVARRVAESVTLTKDQAVRMPFTLSGKLAGMTVTRTSTQIYSTAGNHGEAWSATVQLGPAGTVVKPADDLQQLGLFVDVMLVPGDPSGRIKDRDGQPNTTVNGHPAWRAADGAAVIVFGASGTRSAVGYPDGHGDALAAYADVALLAHPADPSAWQPLK